MKSTIRKTVLWMMMLAAALFVGFAVSMSIATPTAYAASSSIGAPGGSGGGGAQYDVRFRTVTGDPQGRGGGDGDRLIAKLVQARGPGFECRDGVAWGAWAVQRNEWVALLPFGNSNSDPNLAGNWYGPIGGDHPLWPVFKADPDTGRMRPVTTGWIGGCVMQPANRWGEYTNDYNMYDVAASTKVTPATIRTCEAMYDNEAHGKDGYPKGMSYTKEDNPSDGALSADGNTVTTPYGQLYNEVNKNGKYTTPRGSSAEANATRDELVQRANDTCARTQAMKTGVTIPADSDISKAYAKGGIIQVTKKGKLQTISYPITDGEWWWRRTRRTDHHRFNCGASEWYNGHHCDHVGTTINSDWTTWSVESGWMQTDHPQGGGGGNPEGRIFTNSYYCRRPNGDGFATQGEYLNGCWNDVKNKVTVSYTRNSWTHVNHYDILNVLCDKADFEAFRDIIGNAGYGSVSDNSVAGSHRFQGSLVSSVSGDANAGQIPRMSKTLADAGRLKDWDSGKVNAMYASYNASKDPVYTKECPFDCVSDPGTGQAKTNGASANIGTNGATSGRTGVKVNPSDGNGAPSNKITNGADMTFFRNNAWNRITTDVWYPANTDGIRYNGSKAKSTIIRRDPSGTPWGPNGARLESNGTDVFPTVKAGGLGTQTSPSAATPGTYSNGTVTVLNGQRNDFRIRAPWASDPGKPLKFNVKWEYDVDNTATILVSSNGQGDSIAPGFGQTTAKSDGKCDSTHHGSYRPNDNGVHDNTGAGTPDLTDLGFDGSDNLDRAFTVLFVRATSDK